MITITDTHGRPDPQSPSDCLAHCETCLSAGDFELAVTLIDLLAYKRVLEALQDCHAAIRSFGARVSEEAP